MYAKIFHKMVNPRGIAGNAEQEEEEEVEEEEEEEDLGVTKSSVVRVGWDRCGGAITCRWLESSGAVGSHVDISSNTAHHPLCLITVRPD